MPKWTPEQAEYRKAYNRGWNYSLHGTGGLDHGDSRNEPDAWYDGYLDMAAGRHKWHYVVCVHEGGMVQDACTEAYR